MSFTVEEALSLTQLSGVRVLAGKQGISRTIEHVTVVDAPDAVDWLRGGELVLTTAYIIREAPEAQLEFVHRLAASGAAALGIKLRRFIDALSDDVIAFADSVGLPIIEIPFEVAWIDVITPVLTEVVERQASILKRSLDIHTQFIDTVLHGGEMTDIARVLAGQIGTAVAVTDMKWNVIASAGVPSDYGDGLPASWNEEVSLLRSVGSCASAPESWALSPDMCCLPVCAPGVLEHCVVAAAAGDDTRWGRVLVLEPDQRSFTKMDAIAIGHAVTAATLEALRMKAEENVERRFRFSFWDDLMHRRYESPEALVKRARSFALDLTVSHLVLAAAVDTNGPGHAGAYGDGVLLQDEIVRTVETRSSQLWEAPITCFAYRGGGAILAPWSGPDDPLQAKEKALWLARELHQVLNAEIAPRTVSIGVGRFNSDALSVSRSYQEAHECLALGGIVFGRNRVVHFDELGVYRILSKCMNRSELSTFTQDQLEAIERYDTEHNTELLESLECFVDTGGNAQAAADRIFVHVNTMKYRLRRIERIAGIDLSNHETRFNLELALRVRRYLRATR
ncbi:MAG: PucR family transcriptional regulator ligand-binding domain-containing protein [Clostridia bacterium]|nr:PucR family transcriptional regulator ligand-binding domain-containing protein [Clostridia bacterium]